MSGGKGGGSTSEVKIPEYIERAAQRNLNKAEGISQIGYTPYYGPDVAAFTPMQQAAFQNTADASSAFGMAAPTSQQDIMGGMGAPTTYANGVSGYSSQPMFQQSLDQLQAERPGQFDYINSFFIDPFTGQAGSRVSAPVNYENYMTAAESGRREADANRANDLAMAYAEANAGPESYYNYSNIDYSPTSSATSHITNPASGITDTSAPGFGEGAFNDFSEAVVGLGGFFDPTLKVGAINNPIKTPTVSEMVNAAPTGMDYNPTTGGYVSNTDSGPSSSPRPVSRPTGGGSSSSGGFTSLKDMFDGGGPGTSGDTYKNVFTKPSTSSSSSSNSYTPSPAPAPKPYSVEANNAAVAANKAKSSSSSSDSSSSSGGGGTVLCTAYCNMGYLPREIYKLDRRYGVSLYRNDPSLILGYRKWATPIAEFIKTDTLAAKATRAVMWPIVKAWAEQMAHEMKPEKYSRNIAGKAIMLAGVPFSRLVGAVFVDKSVSKEAF